MPRSAVELTMNFDTGESNRDLQPIPFNRETTCVRNAFWAIQN